MFPRLPRLGPRTRYAVGVALLSIAFYVAGRYNITAADIVTGIWNFVLIVWGLARWEPSPSPATKVADTAVSTSTYVVNHQIMPTLTSTTSSNELNGTTMCPLKSAPAFDINSTSPAIFTNMTALTAATSVQVFEVTTKTIVAAKQPIKITETSIGSVAATLVQAVNITKQTDAAPKQAVNATNQNPKTCPNPHYEVQILSYSPLVIYIKNFVTTAEREHLISLA
jgi:hypothetical protein